MDELAIARMRLPESEFLKVVAEDTPAIAVDMQSGRIIYSNMAAEHLFECQVKGGLNDLPYERLIPSERRPAHQKAVGEYEKNPYKREPGHRKMRQEAITLDQKRRFELDITLKPINKGGQLFVVLTFMPAPETKDDYK